jgi:hypothetical protein
MRRYKITLSIGGTLPLNVRSLQRRSDRHPTPGSVRLPAMLVIKRYPLANIAISGSQTRPEKVYTCLYFFGGQNPETKNPANSLS